MTLYGPEGCRDGSLDSSVAIVLNISLIQSITVNAALPIGVIDKGREQVLLIHDIFCNHQKMYIDILDGSLSVR